MHKTLSYHGVDFDSSFLHHMLAHIHRFQCDFKILDLDLGQDHYPPLARISVIGPNSHFLEECTNALLELGMIEESNEEAIFRLASKDGFAPDDFYSIDRQEIEVYYQNNWHPVINAKPTTVVTIRNQLMTAIFLDEIKKGQAILCTNQGIRIKRQMQEIPKLELPTQIKHILPKTLNAKESQAYTLGHVLQKNKQSQAKSIVISYYHPDSINYLKYLTQLIQKSLIQGLIINHQLATLDLDFAFFNTFDQNIPCIENLSTHTNILRAINRINGYGSIDTSYQTGALNKGCLFQCIEKHIPYLIPAPLSTHAILPDAITNPKELRKALINLFKDVSTLIILGYNEAISSYFSLLPLNVEIFCINEVTPHIKEKIYHAQHQILHEYQASPLFFLENLLFFI